MSVLLLASASPRRTKLLSDASVEHTVTPVGVDETWREGEAPVPYACRMARSKAEGAASRPGTVVLAADTVVWTDPKQPPLGKPTTRDEARAMLTRLADPEAPHFVTTAYALLDLRQENPEVEVFKETTRVWMRALTEIELDAYLDGDEWRDKAGGYGIQGAAAGFVKRIEGSYTNVVGLPVAQVLERLAALGLDEAPP